MLPFVVVTLLGVAPSAHSASVAESGVDNRGLETTSEVALWAQVDDDALMVGRGTVEMCGALVFPLELIPVVGIPFALVAEWLCIFPASMLSESVLRVGGAREKAAGVTVAALAVDKFVRDLARIPAVVGLFVTGTTTGALALLLLLQSSGFVLETNALGTVSPLTIATGILSFAVVALVFQSLTRVLADFFAGGVISLAHDEKSDVAERARVETRFGKWWFLSSTALGSTAPFSWWSIVPIVGPIVASTLWYQSTRERMARVGLEMMTPDLASHTGFMDVGLLVVAVVDGVIGIALDLGVALTIISLVVNGTFLLFPALWPTSLGPIAPVYEVLGVISLVTSSVTAVAAQAQLLRRVFVPSVVTGAFGAEYVVTPQVGLEE